MARKRITKKEKNARQKIDSDLEEVFSDDHKLLGVDEDLGLYELTDLFYSDYRYHNEYCLIDHEEITGLREGKFATTNRTLSRFQTFRRLEACRLGSRPFLAGDGVAAHKPNVSLGYFAMMLKYLALPTKSILTDNIDYAKIQVDRRLYNVEKLSKNELQKYNLEANQDPVLNLNKEISEDFSKAYNDVLHLSKPVQNCLSYAPPHYVQEGFVAFLHDDLEFHAEPIEALDLVTEPQCHWDSTNWNRFSIIRKMTAHEVVQLIHKPGAFWNSEALRWALQSSISGRSLIDSRHYRVNGLHEERMQNENFMVKSFFSEKSSRKINVGAYYGNMLVVETYYTNKKGKVNKAVWFPSVDCHNISKKIRGLRASIAIGAEVDLPKADIKELRKNSFANVLYHRENVFEDMRKAITIIPADRSEASLERQRSYGHELFSPTEILMRLDSAIFNLAFLIGTPFVKNRQQGTNAEELKDLNMTLTGDIQDLGDRDFIEIPFQGDLKSLLIIRSAVIQHLMSKAFLGGLDGLEQQTSGRGQGLAQLRLVRDGRIHKHDVEDFSKGLTDFYTKQFRTCLDICDKDSKISSEAHRLIKKRFYDVLTKVYNYDRTFFKVDAQDIIPDTDLPYYLSLTATKSGGSHFGAAEMIVYTELMQTYGSSLSQQQLQNLSRMGIKSLLGAQDALDVLGDPYEQQSFDQIQVYNARMENAAILGSVDGSALNFQQVIVKDAQDDHVLHLKDEHLPLAQQIIEQLNAGDFTPDMLEELDPDALEGRVDLILKLAALSNHMSLHQAQLSRFGSKREDVNRLKEEVNFVLQAAEGLMNTLQATLRALQAKRQETLLKLQGMSPENEAAKLEQQQKIMAIQTKDARDQEKIQLALKIADDKQRQHVDKQLTKARDRNLKKEIADRDANLREIEIAAMSQAKKESASSSE